MASSAEAGSTSARLATRPPRPRGPQTASSIERLAIAHADARHLADGLIPQLAESLKGLNRVPKDKTYVIEVTPAIGVHIGPGAVGVIAMQASAGS